MRMGGVGLFRARTGATRYRYFLAKHEAGKEFLEGPAVLEAARMQCGLAALQNQPLTTFVTIFSLPGIGFAEMMIKSPSPTRTLR